jgi:hypothetical protein
MFVGVLALAGLIAAVLAWQHGSNRPVAVPRNSTSTSSASPPAPVVPKFSDLPTGVPATPEPPGTPSPYLSARRSISLGRAVLGISARYEVLARGPGVLERIQPADGRVRDQRQERARAGTGGSTRLAEVHPGCGTGGDAQRMTACAGLPWLPAQRHI